MKYMLCVVLICIIASLGCARHTTAPTQVPQEAKGIPETNSTFSALTDILSTKGHYTADYEITLNGSTTAMTWVFDRPKFAFKGASVDGEVHTYYNVREYVVCTRAIEWQCFRMPPETPDVTESEDAVRIGTAVATFTGSCSQLGETAQRFDVTKGGITTSVCYTPDGILLESIGPDSRMVATKVSRTIEPVLFEAPAAVQDLISVASNITQASIS